MGLRLGAFALQRFIARLLSFSLAHMVALPNHSDKKPNPQRSIMLGNPYPRLHQQHQPQKCRQSFCGVSQRPVCVRCVFYAPYPRFYRTRPRLERLLILCDASSMKAWGSTLDPNGNSGVSQPHNFMFSCQISNVT